MKLLSLSNRPFRRVFTQGSEGILAVNIKSYTYLCSHERPPKKASDLISLDMKMRESARERERGIREGRGGRRTLVDIAKGWWNQRLQSCDLLLAPHVNMQRWSGYAVCQCCLESKI